MKTIGLTGGIGSGKSTVAAMLEELGAVVIHADTVGHEIYSPRSEGWRRVTETFGTGILGTDQTVDRKKLGAMVFGDAQALKRLNAIVHPLIFDEIQRRIQSHRTSGAAPSIVVEAAVLIEANWLPLVDEVWLVVASKQTAVERVCASRGLSPPEARARVEAQLADVDRRPFAQVVIDNSGSINDLREQVRTAWRRSTAGTA